jgi:chorismate mutase / prephenate dehydratase
MTTSAEEHANQQLQALRVKIDATDTEIVRLLNQRAELAQQVGVVKHAVDAPVYRAEREAQIFGRLRARQPGPANGPLSGAALENIYREVVSACRELERRMRIAYLGPAGTFSEVAALRHFGHSIEAIPCASIEEVFRLAEAGGVDFAVVPVENSTEGAVNRPLDLLLNTPLIISGEVTVPVAHALLAQGDSLKDITKICAHAQALAQCQGWLDKNAPGIERAPVSSNAEGARLASIDASIAGIASERAAQIYPVQVVAAAIQDDPLNRTRFVVLGRYECAPSDADQTSLILSVPDKAGAVHALIEPLARHGVSMKRFESRPARQGSWEYYFYIDLLGHVQDEALSKALAEIKQHAAFYKLLGSYPRA